MPRKLPPLNALRAFEAAARHLSFTRAAEELHVTQAAVSHQVKSLEDYLGIKLFRRFNRSLLLTDEGQTYMPGLTKAFDILDDSTRRLAKKEAGGPLTVSVLPSFAARWLVARLGHFRRSHPEVDLRIDPTADLADFTHGDVDVGIRYGKGDYPGLHSDRLMEEDIFPVCSPTLLEGEHPLKHPEDLAYHTLLHDDGHGDWRTWLLANQVGNVEPTRGTVFTDSSMLVEAAKRGQGVALARSVLAADDIDAGSLIRPFGENSTPSEYAYYIVCPEDTANLPKIKAFREWLLKEARSKNGVLGN